MLVEIIMGKETGDKALAAALDYVRAIKKTPIVVNDARGFFANRCVGAYILEGHLMLTEGVPPAMIENAAQHGRHAGRAAVAQRRGRASTSRCKIVKATKAQLGEAAVDPGAGEAARRDGRGARAASAARTARASTTIPRAGRSASGRASRTCSRRSSIPTRSTSRS